MYRGGGGQGRGEWFAASEALASRGVVLADFSFFLFFCLLQEGFVTATQIKSTEYGDCSRDHSVIGCDELCDSEKAHAAAAPPPAGRDGKRREA